MVPFPRWSENGVPGRRIVAMFARVAGGETWVGLRTM